LLKCVNISMKILVNLMKLEGCVSAYALT